MTLWLLTPRDDLQGKPNPWNPWYDKCFGMVVRAPTEQQARQLADTNAQAEGKGVWLNPDVSNCVKLKGTGPAEVVMQEIRLA